MVRKKKTKRFWTKINNLYRVTILNENDLDAIKQLKFSILSISIIALIAILVFSSGIVSLVFFTSIKKHVPGYPSDETRTAIIRSAILADSLERELEIRDVYFEDLRSVISGETPAADRPFDINDTSIVLENIKIKEFNHDSVFKEKLDREQLSFSIEAENKINGTLSNVLLSSPLKGIITSRFDPINGHYGIDIVAKLNERISSIMDGTVIFSEWTIQTGYVIQIQHEHGLVSVYRHNAELLKKPGDRVHGGEAIALMGNSGQETTGPHLHFEMWLAGTALNPEDYVSF